MARDPQIGFDFGTVDHAAAVNPPLQVSIAADDPMPPGPYSVGLTYWWGGDGICHQGPPWVIECGDGRCVAGHVESRECADAIVRALNLVYPS